VAGYEASWAGLRQQKYAGNESINVFDKTTKKQNPKIKKEEKAQHFNLTPYL